MKRERPDYVLFALTLALVGSGLVLVFSASAILAAEKYGNPYYFLLRQLLWAAAGGLALVALSRVDLERLRPLLLPALFLGFLLMALVAVPGIGRSVGGARRWFALDSLSFQPSELFKLLWVLYLADSLDRRRARLDTLGGYVPYFVLLGAGLFLLELQHDFGTAVLLTGLTLLLFFLSGMRFILLAAPLAVLMPVFVYLVQSASYRLKRITAFLDPWEDPLGAGFQLIQSLIAVGSGGTFGVGLSNSMQKLFYLPAPHTDFIFAILAEETGFLGAGTVVLLFTAFLLRGFRLAHALSKRGDGGFGGLLAAGLAALIGGQAFVNLGVVVGLLPTKGIPLPFLSYGGSSLFFSLSAVGLLLNLSRSARLPREWLLAPDFRPPGGDSRPPRPAAGVR